jgi:geranylgeranyl diphosphate synthase type II
MSLIHDDLPAMDNDDLRRGRPTNHKIYGDALAILAGDALLAFAFQLIAEKTTVPANRILAVISEVGRAASGPGIVGGQVLDLDAEGQQVTLDHLKIIHAKKTGALLEAAVVSGAVLAGGSEVEVARLRTYAANIGLAFQIVDDILDITGNVAQLGKTPGKDQAVQKATYPSLLGLEGSQRLAEQLVQEAKAQLAPWGAGALPLAALADFVTGREH